MAEYADALLDEYDDPTEPCPVCDGEGIIVIEEDGEKFEEDCERCDGTGQIELDGDEYNDWGEDSEFWDDYD